MAIWKRKAVTILGDGKVTLCLLIRLRHHMVTACHNLHHPVNIYHEHADYYSTSAYPLSYSEFKASTSSAGTLAKAWLYNYERPADPSSTEDDRAAAAEYWYGVLAIYDPGAKRVQPWMVQRKKVKNGYIRRKRLYRH